MPKIAAYLLVTLTGIFSAADICRAIALRRWKRGDIAQGVIALRWAGRINPLSVETRIDQIESLFSGYRGTKNPRYLKEAVLIARSIQRNYPGNIQGNTACALTQVVEAIHGGLEYPMSEGLRAITLDPLSAENVELAMFLAAAKRRDYVLFRRLGVQRSRLTGKPLDMRCQLCGAHWLKH